MQILRFEDERATAVAQTGGKGASLAKLTRGGFRVPPGVVVPAEVYRSLTQSDAIRGAIDALDFTSDAALRDSSARVRKLVASIDLPEALRNELQQSVRPLLEMGPVAVRSSSTMEDLAGAAFAGQHDTYLNIRDLDGVAESLRRCWGSLWEDRAVRYRHERGFDQHAASMAVVIQLMVQSDVAGVVFTMNPITGDLGQLMINASFGLGETVVSGEGDVDLYIVAKESGEVVEQRIAEKTNAIVGTESGTAHIELDESKRSASSLEATQLDTLRRLAVDVERFYAFPQDLEFGFFGGELYLLQSRPITKFPARWTRGESAERFPNVVTPLTWDFVSEGFHESLTHSLDLMGMPPFDGHWFEKIDDYVYGNETAVRLFTSGQQVAYRDLDELRALLPVVRERYQWVVRLPVLWARDLDDYLLSLGRLDAADLSQMDEARLWQQIAEIREVGNRYFLPNIAISITHGILHRMLFRLVALLFGAEGPIVYDGLTCFCETKTSVVNADLHELASIVRSDPTLRAMLMDEDRRRVWESGRLAEHPRFQQRFLKLLRDHGHREVDFDTYVPTWVGQPWVVLENIRLLAMQEGGDASSREIELRDRQQQAERRFIERVPEDLRYFAAELARLARVYTALDDLEHYETTRLSVPFRAAIVALGERLVRRGILNAPEDVFFFRSTTLQRVVGRSLDDAAARTEVLANKESYERNAKIAPPWTPGVEETITAADAVRGVPGAPGLAEGAVFRIRSADDFGSFPAGSVLIARTTNPAWTPLFHSAVAVITESGGPLSHGAVTAREVGIPAVMAIRGAMSMFDDGVKVRVNGTSGVVERI